MATEATAVYKKELGKGLAGGIFVLFWLVAIALWIVGGVATGLDHSVRGFIVDAGIVIASIGFAAPFLATRAGFRSALLFGLIGIVLFALAHYADLTPVIYFLRTLGPFLAIVLAPTFKLANNTKIFS